MDIFNIPVNIAQLDRAPIAHLGKRAKTYLAKRLRRMFSRGVGSNPTIYAFVTCVGRQ